MALGAKHGDMFPGQRKRSLRVVVKFSIGPGDRVVARGADRGLKAGLGVGRIVRGIELVHVAARAGSGRVGIVAADVTLRAL